LHAVTLHPVLVAFRGADAASCKEAGQPAARQSG
jgi:hypothetical protein